VKPVLSFPTLAALASSVAYPVRFVPHPTHGEKFREAILLHSKGNSLRRRALASFHKMAPSLLLRKGKNESRREAKPLLKIISLPLPREGDRGGGL
jgi:hypothetical protein